MNLLQLRRLADDLIERLGENSSVSFLYCTEEDVTEIAADVDCAQVLNVHMYELGLEEIQTAALHRAVGIVRDDQGSNPNNATSA